MEEVEVIIVGAGPAGLATAACLAARSIPAVILEAADCSAPLWRRRAYDRLRLHLAKPFCHLPLLPFSAAAPTFPCKADFLRYLDRYVAHFRLCPRYRRRVESAEYRAEDGRWVVRATNAGTGEVEEYTARFLVVATGENAEGVVPAVPGLEGFAGEVMHSAEYKNGERFRGREVLVVGGGNSGMEIAFDLCNHGARTAVAVRSPIHVLSREMVCLGMVLLKVLRLPCSVVDKMVSMMGQWKYGDVSRYGLARPTKGPFDLKASTGRSPVIDVGTMDKIDCGQIKVLSAPAKIGVQTVHFINGEVRCFDAIVFATGYRSTAKKWLKDDGSLLNEEGMPMACFPNHWKGSRGLYCAGLAKRGLAGISMDAQWIANDIDNKCWDRKKGK